MLTVPQRKETNARQWRTIRYEEYGDKDKTK